jgi:hypothetical protein
VQISQRTNRDLRRPESHAGADTSVEHPIRKYCYNTRFDLNVDATTVSALLTVLRTYMSAVKRMPAVVNFNFLPDMGRMTA